METKSHERKPAEVRRFEILYAARKLFCKRGYHRVSMEDVASEVGISKAGVYLYFPSKLELFFAMIDKGVDKLIADLRKAFDDPRYKNLEKKLDASNQALKGYAPVFRVSQQLMSTGMPDSDFPPRLVARFMNEMDARRQVLLKLFADLFSKAQKRGEVRADISPEDLATVFGVYGMLMTRFEVSYQTAKEILFHGILVKEVKR